MNGLGYYSMTEPMVDTYMTPFPIAFPDEDVSPVPGWGMNPMLAGPYWIAVGDAAAPTPASTMLKRYVLAPLVVGGIIYFASKKQRVMYAALGAVGALVVGSALEKAGA